MPDSLTPVHPVLAQSASVYAMSYWKRPLTWKRRSSSRVSGAPFHAVVTVGGGAVCALAAPAPAAMPSALSAAVTNACDFFIERPPGQPAQTPAARVRSTRLQVVG